MRLEDLNGIFVDGRVVDLQSTSIEMLENMLEKVRMQRVEKIQKIANIVEENK